jgi:alpha-tubulin suppressor-like RCC1 family protein
MYSVSKAFARMVSKSSNSNMFGSSSSFHGCPTLLQGQIDIKDVSCSAGLTLYLTGGGQIYCFGQNRWMQCGLKPEDNLHVYQPSLLTDIPAASKFVAGLQHGIAMTKDGDVFTWGKSDKGRLGCGPESPKEYCFGPRKVLLAHPRTGDNMKAIDVSAGFANSAAVSDDGALYVWGKGMSIQDSDKGKGLIKVFDDQFTPRRITLPGNRQVVRVYSRLVIFD